MKQLILIFILLFTIPYSSAKVGPEISFESLSFDLGTIHEAKGEVECKFKYTNTGDMPLCIASVSTACNCTKASFNARPISPGKSDIIHITFSPKDMSGEFMRSIQVWTNIKNGNKKKKITLQISGVVIPKS